MIGNMDTEATPTERRIAILLNEFDRGIAIELVAVLGGEARKTEERAEYFDDERAAELRELVVRYRALEKAIADVVGIKTVTPEHPR